MAFKRGELYRLKADAVGKPRPVVIVSCDAFNAGRDLLVVQFGSQMMEARRSDLSCAEFGAGEGGLTEACMATTGFLLSIKKTELQMPRIGVFTPEQMRRVIEALKWTLDLE